MKHCPICDRSSDEIRFFGEFCEDCTKNKLRAKLENEADIELCRDCGRIKVLGRFVPENRESIEQLMQNRFRRYGIKLLHSSHGIARLKITDEKLHGIELEHNVHLRAKRVLCDTDAKKRSGYYEAVVQLRGDEGKVGRISEALQRYLERNGAFAAKIEERQHGVDVYASDRKTALAFITVRHLRWKGAFELHGMKGNRRLYRNTYFITL